MAHEFDGRKYAQASAHQQEWGERLISELSLSGAEHILDLGCGDGRVTAQLAALVPAGQVLGIDASAGMIEVAREKLTGNLAFRRMDINALDFEEAFDVIFSNATLHWITDHAALLPRIRRALRQGGVIRFNFGAEGNCSHLYSVAREAMALPAFSPDFTSFSWPWHFPSISTYGKLVTAAGYRDVQVWGEAIDRAFADQELMLRWVDQPCIVPFLAHLPTDSREPFRRYVHRRMVEETSLPDGTCMETFRRINVFARR